MRLRPIGPGIGGLYYSALLREVHKRNRGRQSVRPLSPPEGIANSSRARHAWVAVAAAGRRFADRLVQARLAQARAQIARTTAILDATSPGRPRYDIGVRYY